MSKISLTGLPDIRADRFEYEYRDGNRNFANRYVQLVREWDRIEDCSFAGSAFSNSSKISGTEFIRCNFAGAQFRTADMWRTKFIDCILTGSDIDPKAEIDPSHGELLREWVREGVLGHDPDYPETQFRAWRTYTSQYWPVRSTETSMIYFAGQDYTADVFNVDPVMLCAPGLYVSTPHWLLNHFEYEPSYIEVRVPFADALVSDGGGIVDRKIRTRRFHVIRRGVSLEELREIRHRSYDWVHKQELARFNSNFRIDIGRYT